VGSARVIGPLGRVRTDEGGEAGVEASELFGRIDDELFEPCVEFG
jgi:hypothetical protein